MKTISLICLTSVTTAAQAAFGQLVRDTTVLPPSQFAPGSGEAVALVDVDLDGDLDVVLARAGDSLGVAQNFLWINQGGAQGGTEGTFTDETALRLPLLWATSFGLEPGDIDGDGDADLLLVNWTIWDTSRWWINQGGLQGGSSGYFVDDTDPRWVGIGGPGSSFPGNSGLGVGRFAGLSRAASFGDLDGDGDLDLVYAGVSALGGATPTRIFLNDGLGRFEEFNPSGYRLTTSALGPGEPGLWCDGVQRPLTTDSSGAECDIALVCHDVDVADVDGDFDLDILACALHGVRRMYANRSFASGLAPAAVAGLGFRDVTSAAFPFPQAVGPGSFAVAFGDLDRDGDLDVYGSNWSRLAPNPSEDVTLANLGSGIFGAPSIVPGSHDVEDDCVIFDFDGDGRLDVASATLPKLQTNDTLFRNESTVADQIVLVDRSHDLTDTSSHSSGAAAGDLDGDGDHDLFLSGSYSTAQVYFENRFDVPDTHAPRIPAVEAAPHREAGATVTVVRAHVLDDAPEDQNATHPAWLRYRVDGGATTDVPMRWMGGQLFRGELPGHLVGLVEYSVVASDRRGNSGNSAWKSYLAVAPGQVGAAYCAPNPNSTGAPARMGASGSNELVRNDLVLHVSGLPQGSAGYFLVSADRGSIPNPFGSQGLLCLGGLIGRFVAPGQIQNSGAAGAVHLAVDLTSLPSSMGPIVVAPGELWHFTYWYRDANPGPATNLADGWSIAFE
jgi:hypothetical protein